jgi:glycosyltransferase involved in cell wall biosynthesis
MSRKKKILFLIPSLVGGGAERVLINMLQKFDYKRFDVDLCVGINRGIYFKEIPEEVKLIELFNSSYLEKAFIFLHRQINSQILLKILINRKIRDKYDVGVSFIDSTYTDFLLFLGDKIKQKVAWVHSSYTTYINYSRFYKGKYKTRLLNKRYKKIDKIIFVSNDSRIEFENIFGEFSKSYVIYNILNVEGIKYKALEEIKVDDYSDRINIVAMGSLYPVKGYEKLICATKKLKEDKLPFKVRILGNGYLKKELHNLITTLELDECVELLGFISNPYPILKAADIFVMTSLSEALPTSLCEAMILGLPCVVTDCSGCREIVGNGEYGIMTGQTIDEIYSGIKTLITSQEYRNKYSTLALKRAEIFNDSLTLEKIYSIL